MIKKTDVVFTPNTYIYLQQVQESVEESNVMIQLKNTPSKNSHPKSTLSCVSSSNSFKMYFLNIGSINTPKSCNNVSSPITYLTKIDSLHLLCKLYLTCGHINFSMNKPPLSPIL